MLRPATPLAILLAGAFVLLLISIISAPIVKSIYIGKANDVVFGVFGFCPAKGDCSKVGIGYDSEKLLNGAKTSFQLPASVRKTLSSILVLHPVAAFITLVMFVMAAASHAHAAAHSARFLLVLFIFILIDFLITLAAFIVDILLFIPNQAFGTYLVLAAAIMIAISGGVSFFMRRTIVSRKARKNRIAENAEMSGENYYNREGQNKPMTSFSTQPTVPTFSGGANGGAHDNLPAFASFESRPKDDQVSDERIPLTQQRSPGTNHSDIASAGRVGPQRAQSRDRYGNPVNPGDAYSMHSRPSYERMNRPPGRGDMAGAYRGQRGGGRGGYGRGGFDAYGAPMRGRGGHGPGPGRGGMGPRGRGGYPRGGFAPGMGPGPGMGRGGRSPTQAYAVGHPQDRRPSTEGYDAYGAQPGQGEYAWGGSNNPSLNNVNPYDADLPRAESPPPLPASESDNRSGHVMEMDATPIDQHPHGFGNAGQIRDSDTDVAGMVNLQQGHDMDHRRPGYMSDGSKYSTDEQYIPPRAGWNNGSGRNSPRGMSPLHTGGVAVERGPSSPLAAAPSRSGNYYEDVDPRFEPAEQQPVHLAPPPIEPMYEDTHANADGTRSPAESERSNFTSVSQRGVNPRWNPHQHPPMPPQGMGQRRAVQQRQDMLLDNPDFQLGGRSGKPKHGMQGMVPGSAYPTAPM